MVPYPRSSGWNRRVLFLDGFAGPGVYADGEPGSPLIVLSTLVSHSAFERLSATEFAFLFVEADAARLRAYSWNSNGIGQGFLAVSHPTCECICLMRSSPRLRKKL